MTASTAADGTAAVPDAPAEAPAPRSPYLGLRVVELADDIAGEMSGRFLAEMGAEVIKVEPPEGSPTRRIGPFAHHDEGVDRSLTFWYYNLNKSSVVLDRTSDAGRAQLADLLDDADVVVSTLSPEALAELGLTPGQGRHESLIVLSVTPFGLDGPWSGYRSTDLIGLAAGGPLNSCGYDDHEIPPIRPGGNQAFHTAASFAHLGLLLALIARRRDGKGQLVDVSMHESCAVTVELANPYWFYPRALVQRQTCRHAQPVPTQPTLFKAADGRYLHFVFITTEVKPWEQIVAWLSSKGLEADLGDERYLDPKVRQQEFGHIQSIIEVFFLVHDAETLYREGQAHGLPIGVVNAPEELLDDRHLQARGAFVPVEAADGTVARHPALPYRFTTLVPPTPRRAPSLGEHTTSILSLRSPQEGS